MTSMTTAASSRDCEAVVKTAVAVRHAEKSRGASSCLFADRVATLSVQSFQLLCPSELRSLYKQTVLATVIVQFPKVGSDGETELVVVGLGVGTKVLPAAVLREERQRGLTAGRGDRRVRDMHAEILAKRAFQRYLLEELQRWKAAGCADDNCLFQLAPPSQTTTITSAGGDEKGEESCVETVNGLASMVRIRPEVNFHLYSTSQPCGNACIKRWAASKKAAVFDQLSGDEIPVERHDLLQVTARSEGQVALLTKRNDAANAVREEPSAKVKEDNNILRHPSGLCHPVGTAPMCAREGNVMTCSDKIAKWNVLGLQGSILSHLVSAPMYLSSITVGRKFSSVHCRRALCCRVAKFQPSASSSNPQAVEYHTNHPAMLGSSVKFDDSVIVQASEEQLSGASFDIYSCFCAWPSTPQLRTLNTDTLCDLYTTEVIDGHTGLLEGTDDNEEENLDHRVSRLSSFALGSLAEALIQKLKSYHTMKADAIAYQTAKQQLVSDKELFFGWIQK